MTTEQQIQDLITDLREVRAEITRVNKAAGVTVFNPAATDAVDAWISDLQEELEE